ncbi:hypothetical protein HCJ66_08670 [Listeria sp. FSL L7-1582]|uniref:hypothetical protein n=1 Tax=Listeria portnoyi TaxID=2713504 RepID=UPI00164CDF9B|nr:hypothetical protein [Listeria portnoyi]MBC6309630.1 hypothetical protein [Listeria portnoyi]
MFHSKNNYIACICEGSTEQNLINLLLEQNLLSFSKDQLLEKNTIKGLFRDSTKFTNRFLTRDYGDKKITIFIIQDKKTSYTIKDPYSKKIEGLYQFVTSPEIEMLMIHSLSLYKDYQKVKSTQKPSCFVAEKLKTSPKKIKRKEFIEDFFTKHDLKTAIISHKSNSKKVSGSYFLADLLK